MIQFGICIFKFDPATSKLTAHPFNFWTFPRNHHNSLFLSDSSSLSFLREHGFDFNKMIDEGIDFLSIDGEKRERQHRQYQEQRKQERTKERKVNNQIVEPRTAADIQLYKSIESKIRTFAAGKSSDSDLNSNPNSNSSADGAKEGVLHLGFLSRFMRLLVYQLVDQQFADQLVAYKLHPNSRRKSPQEIAVKRVTIKSRQRVKEEAARKLEEEWNESMSRKVGVRHVFDLLVEHRVPTVLHNGMLDAMHLYRSFIGPLPEDPCSFSKRLHNHFPFVLDTKYMMQLLFRENLIAEHYSLSQCLRFFMNRDDGSNINLSGGGEDEDVDIQQVHISNVDIQSVVDMEVYIPSDAVDGVDGGDSANGIDGGRNSQKEEEFMNSEGGQFHQAGYGMNSPYFLC